jgi:Mrp family chromosome partitioning ATPase
MGRVHKALTRADQWRDMSQPIGRPAGAREGDEQLIKAGAAPVRDFDLTTEYDSAAVTGQPYGESSGADDVLLDWEIERLSESLPSPAMRTHPTRTVDVNSLAIDERLSAIRGEPLASERYRTIAMRLINAVANGRVKTIVVTSADDGEGKTTIAANLAWAMARASGNKVLLLDANVASPTLAARLGIEAAATWSELLNGRASMQTETMVRIESGPLTVLAIRPEPGHGQGDGFLGGKKAAALLDELRAGFDLVFIDAPSLLESVEAQWLVTIADAAVIVARSGRTKGHRLASVRRIVPKSKRLGVVLNDLPVKGGRPRTKPGRLKSKDERLGSSADYSPR